MPALHSFSAERVGIPLRAVRMRVGARLGDASVRSEQFSSSQSNLGPGFPLHRNLRPPGEILAQIDDRVAGGQGPARDTLIHMLDAKRSRSLRFESPSGTRYYFGWMPCRIVHRTNGVPVARRLPSVVILTAIGR